jgi:hypothetical protein
MEGSKMHRQGAPPAAAHVEVLHESEHRLPAAALALAGLEVDGVAGAGGAGGAPARRAGLLPLEPKAGRRAAALAQSVAHGGRLRGQVHCPFRATVLAPPRRLSNNQRQRGAAGKKRVCNAKSSKKTEEGQPQQIFAKKK